MDGLIVIVCFIVFMALAASWMDDKF